MFEPYELPPLRAARDIYKAYRQSEYVMHSTFKPVQLQLQFHDQVSNVKCIVAHGSVHNIRQTSHTRNTTEA